MVRISYLAIHVFSKLCVLCVFGLSFNIGYCSAAVQAIDNDYSVADSRSRSLSENFFSRDSDLQSRLHDFLKVKNYAFRGLKGSDARESAIDIIDSLMSWNYSDSLKVLPRTQVLKKVLQDFRECYRFYYQERERNESTLELLAPFAFVKKVLGE